MEATKQEIMVALGLQEIEHFEKYLGLPSLVGRRKKELRLQLYQRKCMEKIARMGRETIVSSRSGGAHKSGDTSYSYLCYGVFQITLGPLP